MNIPVTDVTEQSSELEAFEKTINGIADMLGGGPMPLVFLALPKSEGKLPTVAASIYALDEQVFAMAVGLLSLMGQQRLGDKLSMLPPEAQQVAAQIEGMKMVNQYLVDAVKSEHTPASDAAGSH